MTAPPPMPPIIRPGSALPSLARRTHTGDLVWLLTAATLPATYPIPDRLGPGYPPVWRGPIGGHDIAAVGVLTACRTCIDHAPDTRRDPTDPATATDRLEWVLTHTRTRRGVAEARLLTALAGLPAGLALLADTADGEGHAR